MRAYVIRGPQQATVENVPLTEPGAGEVRLRVHASALNHMDLFMREGFESTAIRPKVFPRIGGADIAGHIDAVGPGVDLWQAGERVVVYPGTGCHSCRACHAGELSICRSYGVIGEQRWGGLAERVVVPAWNLHRLPDHVDDFTAAAVPAAYTTAWRMLASAGCRVGSRVLVIGVGGGVASAALLLARAMGARVYVTSGQEWKLRRAAELGAVAGFDHSAGGIDAWAWDATDGEGVDVVIDSVGATTWRQSIRSLAPGGAVAICGATSGDMPEISIRELYQRHGRIVGAPLGGRRDFDGVMDLITAGAIAPVVDRVYPLPDVESAFERLEAGAQFGKVVIACSTTRTSLDHGSPRTPTRSE